MTFTARPPRDVSLYFVFISAPVSRMTEAAAAKAVAELRDRARWLETQWIEARGLEAQPPGAS